MKRIKIITAVLTVILITLICACEKKPSVALTISGAEVPVEVFAYYLDCAINSPDRYGLPSDVDIDTARDKAAELCAGYVAANTLAAEHNLKITAEHKRIISDRVSVLWNLNYVKYETVGITKDALTKIETAAEIRDVLLLYYYGPEGKTPVSQEEIRAYYEKNFISFIAINGYLSTTDEEGKAVNLSEEEKRLAASRFETMRVRALDGESFEELSAWLSAQLEISIPVPVVRTVEKDNMAYPAEFVQALEEMGPGTPTVITVEPYIFLVQKEEPDFEGEEFQTRQSSFLYAIKGEEIDSMLKTEAERYEIVSNEDNIADIIKKAQKFREK
ncbi:MAG: hypothetical protein ACOYJX_06505 [Acutalibacteraceae bacterium]|jgi:hypothetical protein